jgi:hypothetical protein
VNTTDNNVTERHPLPWRMLTELYPAGGLRLCMVVDANNAKVADYCTKESAELIVSAVNATQRPPSPLPSPERVAEEAVTVSRTQFGYAFNIRLNGAFLRQFLLECNAQDEAIPIRRALAALLRARDAEHGATCKQSLQVAWTPAATPPTGTVEYELTLLLLEERQVTARMEQDVRKYGEFQCDYNTWLREIGERRTALLSGPLPPLPELPATEIK